MTAGNLRLMEEKDLPLVLQWRNTPRIQQTQFSDQTITWKQHTNWFRRSRNDPRVVNLVYEVLEVPVGVVNFASIDALNRRCLWGFYIGVEDAPKGTGFGMGCAALDYAFDKLDMRKVSGEVLAGNTPSRNFHLKLGFREEGYFLQHVLKGGVLHDVVFFSLFKQEWRSRPADGGPFEPGVRGNGGVQEGNTVDGR